MRNKIRYTIYVVVSLLVIYRVGPRLVGEASDNHLPLLKYDITSVEDYVNEYEAKFEIKKDNEARILWSDSTHQQTDYCLLYLHGFSASWYEGYPVNTDFVQHFKCNAYFARLAEHGIVDEAPLLNMTPKRLYDSAKEALLVALTLGKKVIIMSTSTGGTLSLMLAADYPDLVSGLFLYSPNVKINKSTSLLLTKPWGLKIGEWSEGGAMRHLEGSPLEHQYWNLDYRMEAVVYLQQLIDERMNDTTFAKVKCPVFLGYYYKDKKHQDDVVSVDALLEMYDALGSEKKQKMAFPNAGRHTIAFIEAGNPKAVTKASIAFAEQQLGMH